MAWPPTIPPATRANSTTQLDSHPSDHNAISAALTDIVAQVNPTAWTALPLGSGWANAAAPWAACQYRLIGDVVQVRGQPTRASGSPAGTTIGTLPAGFRPAYQYEYGQNGSAGLWAIGVNTAGAIYVAFAPTSTAPCFVDIFGMSWSVT